MTMLGRLNLGQNQSGPLGRRMMLGTYTSEEAIYSFIPENVPKPIAWGSYKSNPDMWFYLADFHEMVDEVPDIIPFIDAIRRLQQGSSGKSPEGKFGFPVSTHLANIPNRAGWKDTWEETFTEALSDMMEIELMKQGPADDEFEELKQKTLQVVIPRLLRPLEIYGTKLIPCLVHTDLWPGNAMPDADTDAIMFFDSSAIWAHGEYEMAAWRAPRYRLGPPYMREYQKRVGVDHPAEDWDDRNLLYSL